MKISDISFLKKIKDDIERNYKIIILKIFRIFRRMIF